MSSVRSGQGDDYDEGTDKAVVGVVRGGGEVLNEPVPQPCGLCCPDSKLVCQESGQQVNTLNHEEKRTPAVRCPRDIN